MITDVVFATIHGSKLYGLDHEDSDHDTFVVTDSHRRKVKHTVTPNGQDVTEVGIWRFLELALSGSHQSCEALFSEVKDKGPKWDKYSGLIENLSISGAEVFSKYERTIRKFCYGNFKMRRHAVRLCFNLQDLRKYGRFDPTLSDIRKDFCNETATNLEGDELAEYLYVK